MALWVLGNCLVKQVMQIRQRETQNDQGAINHEVCCLLSQLDTSVSITFLSTWWYRLVPDQGIREVTTYSKTSTPKYSTVLDPAVFFMSQTLFLCWFMRHASINKACSSSCFCRCHEYHKRSWQGHHYVVARMWLS